MCFISCGILLKLLWIIFKHNLDRRVIVGSRFSGTVVLFLGICKRMWLVVNIHCSILCVCCVWE